MRLNKWYNEIQVFRVVSVNKRRGKRGCRRVVEEEDNFFSSAKTSADLLLANSCSLDVLTLIPAPICDPTMAMKAKTTMGGKSALKKGASAVKKGTSMSAKKTNKSSAMKKANKKRVIMKKRVGHMFSSVLSRKGSASTKAYSYKATRSHE